MRKSKLIPLLLALIIALGGCGAPTETAESTIITAQPAHTQSSVEENKTINTPASPTVAPQAKEPAVAEAQPAESQASADTPTPAAPAAESSAENKELSCTISISCNSINAHLEDLDPSKHDLVPADGWILAPCEAVFYDGENVFNVLLRTCKQNKIHMEYKDTPLYNSAYICGIGNLYEFDCGDLSGWMYAVNGIFPNYGCSQYELKDGDKIEFIYTCDLGASEQADAAQ